jgi:hypothetical protein
LSCAACSLSHTFEDEDVDGAAEEDGAAATADAIGAEALLPAAAEEDADAPVAEASKDEMPLAEDAGTAA